MKLVNAKLYEDQIKLRFWEIWYDEDYQFYFGNNWRYDFSVETNTNGYQNHDFAVVNDDGKLLGYIGYSIDTEIRIAKWFGAVNFSDDKLAFGRALYQVIMNCFLKFGMEVVEWDVIRGNPIEKSYDRLCKKFGGTIIGISHNRVRDFAGNMHDKKTYEILRENFLSHKNGLQKEMETFSRELEVGGESV